jgi:hypothetical protein
MRIERQALSKSVLGKMTILKEPFKIMVCDKCFKSWRSDISPTVYRKMHGLLGRARFALYIATSAKSLLTSPRWVGEIFVRTKHCGVKSQEMLGELINQQNRSLICQLLALSVLKCNSIQVH